MVEGSLWRQFPILGFIEHPCIFGILCGEFLFNLLSGLSEGGGKCEFSDVGVVFS